MKLRQTLLTFAALLLPAVLPELLPAQGLDPAVLLQPPVHTWPTYQGDYSGRRYSPLDQINQSNVKDLTLAWVWHKGATRQTASLDNSIKATPLEINGILYFSAPDHVWAVDAYTGKQIWHYEYPPNDGLHIGSRGVALDGNRVYFETPDNYLICLDAKTGKQIWKLELADVRLDYFSTAAPVLVKNHLIVSVGGDTLDNPGYIEARDPATGALQWRWYTEPRPGEPGADTWPDAGAREHGGGMAWIPGTYDPELNLIYWGVGNPNPVYDGLGRKGDDLYTDSIVALNPDTGKLVWYYQTTPHDTHDWDSVQTPILIDATIDGQPRKLLAQTNRSGFYYLLDRTNGKHLVTAPFAKTNWSRGYDVLGRPIALTGKEPSHDGVLVCPASGGASNWMPSSFDPSTGMVYVVASDNCSIYYLTAEGKGEGFAGRDFDVGGSDFIRAIDFKTGKVVWSYAGGTGGGLLTTAGHLLFGSEQGGNLVALDPETGKPLWHARVGTSSNPPITYELNGRQYVLFGVDDSLYAFTLPQ